MSSNLKHQPAFHHTISKILLATFCLLLFLLASAAVGAQTRQTCDNGSLIRVDSGHHLDQPALCAATQQWADKGIQVTIYLTDYVPETETDWFDHLDQVEVELGLISANQSIDDFAANTLALEVTTAASENFGTTITIGRQLFDTPIASDANLGSIKAQILDDIQRENYTGAYVSALNDAYAITYPPSRLPLIIGVLLAVAIAIFVPVRYGSRLRAFLQLQREKLRLYRHQAAIREPIAHLLAALNRLLEADSPLESLLYRLFESYGGAQYVDMQTTAINQIRQAQTALSHIFNQWQHLPLPEDDTLEKQVQRMESLYLGLVGTKPRSQKLTNETLRDVLLPSFTVRQSSLADEISQLRQLAAETLIIELRLSKPDTVTLVGILDHIDAVKQLLAQLVQAESEAKPALEAASKKQKAMAAAIPDDFLLTPEALFSGIEGELAQANDQLADGRYLTVCQQTRQIDDNLEAINRLITLLATYEQRSKQITDLVNAGYRAPALLTVENELSLSLNQIKDAFHQANYEAGIELLEEFDMDSQFALKETEAWQKLYEQNQQAIQQIKEKVTYLITYRDEISLSTWEQLQAYPAGNWDDLAEYLDEAAQLLQQIQSEQLPRYEKLNDLDNREQRFDAIETELTITTAQLAQVEYKLEALNHRFEEVKAAAEMIESAVQVTSSELAKVISLRDAEDAKIGPHVDKQIEEAQAELSATQAFIEKEDYRSAIVAQSRVRHLARQAFSTATAEVDRINTLLEKLGTTQGQVDKNVPAYIAEARNMPAVMQTQHVVQAAKELEAQWSVAQVIATQTADREDTAWANALEEAIIAYQTAEKVAQLAQTHIQAARQEYERLVDAARRAIRKADQAIEAAERERRHTGVGSAGRETLKKAKAARPSSAQLSGATKETLKRICRQAEQARDHAWRAERQARDAYRRYVQRQQRDSHDSWSGWSSSSSSSSRSFSSSRSSRSSSSRSSGSTSSRHRH